MRAILCMHLHIDVSLSTVKIKLLPSKSLLFL